MRRSLSLATALVLGTAASLAAAEEWSKVRIATEGAYPPWNHTDASGQLVGFELDLARDLCARMDAECEIVAQDWEGIIPALQDGKYDAIMAGMSITDERRKVIQFTDAYAATPARFAVLEDSELADYQSEQDRLTLDDIDTAEQAAVDDLRELLDGKTVGVQVATTHANFLETHLSDAVDIRKYDTQENLDLDLKAGRVDAALASMSYWQPLLETEKGAGFTLIGPAMTGGPFGDGVGLGIRQEDDELVEKFNEAIAAAREDGTIRRLAEEWFGFDASS
ncbi:MAG TPA: lysine/arginine/ornithine ABC transporter substrate-binding protein [Geminicoccaceae bacterium]